MKKLPSETLELRFAVSPFSLLSIRILSLEINEVGKVDEENIPTNSISVSHSIDSDPMSCTVIIELQAFQEAFNSVIHSLHVVIEGKYGADPQVSDEQKKEFFASTAPAANLLGFLRGMIFQATSFSLAGPFFVPLFDLKNVTPAKNPSSKRASKKKSSGKNTALNQ